MKPALGPGPWAFVALGARHSALGGVVAAVLLAGGLNAQGAPGQLTLEDALRIARERSPDYQRARNTLDAASVQARAGWGGFLPDISASLSFSGNSSTRVTGEDDFGRPVDLPDPVTFRSSSSLQGVNASVTLFDGLANFRTARAANLGRDAAEAGVDAAWTSVAANVTRQFFVALREQRLIELEERLLASAREKLDATERRFRVAGANQTDVLGAQVDVAQREQALARQRGSAEKAVLTLRATMGLAEDVPFLPVGEPPAPFDPSAFDPEGLVARARAASSLIAQREASAAAADARAGAAHGSRWPRVTLSGGFSRSVSLPSFDAFGELNPRNRGLGFQIGLTFPLFTGFQTSATIAQAEATRDNAEEDLRAARLQLEADVRGAVIDLKNAYSNALLAERSAELARQRLHLAQERYQLGALQYIELQQVIDQAAGAERTAVDARFEFARALVTLEELVGASARP